MSDRIFQLLLVEDSLADVRLFKETLRIWKACHNLHVASNGEQALNLLHHRGVPTPDLICLDLNMPKIDGFEVLRSVRHDANPEIRSIPIVVFTSSSDSREVAKAYDLGANVYVTKPDNLDEFFRVMAGVESFLCRVAAIHRN